MHTLCQTIIPNLIKFLTPVNTSTIELVDTQIPKISGSSIKQGSWVASWPFLGRKWGLPNDIWDRAIVHNYIYCVLKLTCAIHMVRVLPSNMKVQIRH